MNFLKQPLWRDFCDLKEALKIGGKDSLILVPAKKRFQLLEFILRHFVIKQNKTWSNIYTFINYEGSLLNNDLKNNPDVLFFLV